jgi:hypothetical protein
MGERLEQTDDLQQEQYDTDATDDTSIDQSSQISDMISMFGEGDSTDNPEEEPASGDDVKKGDEPEKEDEPEKDEHVEDTKDEEPTPQDKKISELTAKIEELTKLISDKNGPEKEKTPTEEDYFKARLDEVQKDLASDYVSEDDYEAVFEKREKLNEVLKRVQSDTIQGVFRSIPKIIASIIPQHIVMYNKTAEFYGNNSDLLAHKEKVGELIDKVSAENPGWDLDEILEFVGGKPSDPSDIGALRKALGLKKKAEKKAEQTNVRRPSFAKPSHPKVPGKEVKLTGIDKEISDMIEST